MIYKATSNKIIKRMLVEVSNSKELPVLCSQYYFKKENKKLLRTYGQSIIAYSRQLDVASSFPDPLKYHKIDSKFRTKLVDWMFEVFLAINCAENTIYLTLHLFDAFLFKYKENVLENDHIHLIGVCCMFIASKTEDLCPLFMNDLKVKICHNRFSETEIKKMERLILNVLGFGIIIHSMGEYIRTYFYEFRLSNRSNILSKEQDNNFNEMEIFAIFISKVILHSDAFSSYKASIKAIACIVIAFEIVRTHKKVSTIEEELLKKWILTLMDSSQYDPDDINTLYNVIADYYTSFQNLQIPHNLLKTANLPY